jgi:hypothetical protein
MASKPTRSTKPTSWTALAAKPKHVKKPIEQHPKPQINGLGPYSTKEREPKYMTTKTTCLAKQSHDVIIAVLKFVPFVDQITLMCETGNLALWRLYKACMKNNTTTFVFDKRFCEKLLSRHLDPVFKIPQKTLSIMDADGFIPAGKTVNSAPKKQEIIKPNHIFPTGIITKIPSWIQFDKFIFHHVISAGCTGGSYYYECNVPAAFDWKTSDKNCVADLRELLLRSKTKLTSIYTEKAPFWLINFFQMNDENGDKIFTAASDFQCEHLPICDCPYSSTRLAHSGLFLMGVNHYEKRNNFVFTIPLAETVTTVRTSECTIDFITDPKSNFRSMIDFIHKSVPNLEAIEIVIDFKSHVKPKDFTLQAKELQELRSKNIFVKACREEKTLECTNYTDNGAVIVTKLKTLFSELGSVLDFGQIDIVIFFN